MPVSSRTPRTRSRTTTRPKRLDAIAVLKADHQEVEQLFKRFESTGAGAVAERRSIADRIIAALEQHAAIEERLLYPWMLDYIENRDDEVREAIEEHRVVKWLLTEIAVTSAEDDRFGPRVTVLIEMVRHHVKEEEQELFVDLRNVATRAELLELGDALRTAKSEARTETGIAGKAGKVAASVDHAREVGHDAVNRVSSLVGID